MLSPQKLKRVAALPQLLRNRIRGPEDLKRFPGLKSAKLVTLDVFDTALLRSVAQPTDALALAAWRTDQRHNLNLGMRPLLEARRTSESTARQKARATRREEVTLDEIYATFPGPLSTAAPLMHAEELATERDICSANPAILAIYEQLVASNTPVAFLSDTYFPQPFLESLLFDSGYDGPHQVFVSSHFGTSKAHGALFAKVAAQLALQPRDIWHIGDNVQSDVLQARRSGLQALWYRPKLRRPTHQDRTKYARDERSLARSLMAGIPESLRDQTSTTAQPWKQMGVSVAGPLYLAFTQWLLKKSSEFSPERIYFCARDGQIVQKVYDRLRACHQSAPASSYLMASRRALLIPSLEKVDEVIAGHLVGGDHLAWLPVEEYLTRIRLNPDNYRAQMDQLGLPAGTMIDGEPKRAKLRRLLQDLEPEILGIARQERDLLLRYLQQEGCLDTGKLALCDIGWRGSLQRSLTAVAKEKHPDTEVVGYYFATYGPGHQANFGGPAYGWVIDGDLPESRRRILQSGITIVEFLFTARHGTVLHYADKQGAVEAALAPVGVNAEYADAADQVQREALRFVDRYIRAFSGLQPPALGLDDAFPLLARLIDRPTLAEAKAIGDLVLADGLGTFRFGQPIAQPPSFWQMLARPASIRDKFVQAPWRLGLLVRLLRSPELASAAMALRRRLELKPKSA
jgi:FMN phosphatase YigB (HAD superfamily)